MLNSSAGPTASATWSRRDPRCPHPRQRARDQRSRSTAHRSSNPCRGDRSQRLTAGPGVSSPGAMGDASSPAPRTSSKCWQASSAHPHQAPRRAGRRVRPTRTEEALLHRSPKQRRDRPRRRPLLRREAGAPRPAVGEEREAGCGPASPALGVRRARRARRCARRRREFGAAHPSWRSRLYAALISARWVKAWGKLPSCSPVGPICSEYSPT
jgi:hypothetical protein